MAMDPRNGRAIIDVDELLPGDVAFVVGGVEYLVPGDPPLPMVLGLIETFQEMQAIDGTDAATPDRVAELTGRLHEQVTEVFRIRDPQVELQVGMRGLVAIVAAILDRMGADVLEEGGARPRKGGRSRSTTAPSSGSSARRPAARKRSR